jgi:hypothetical protein
MKWLLALLFSAALPAQAAVCGLYQVEDFGDRVLYTITRISEVQTLFTITNPGTPLVKDMVRGMCYCAEGVVLQDPEFEGDENYQLLTVESLEGAPYMGCMPDQK